MKKKKRRQKKFKGFTHEEIESLKLASKKPPSKYKKRTLCVFKCVGCEKEYYYKIGRCLLCDSLEIKNEKRSTSV